MEAKIVAAANERVANVERELCKAEAQASEVEQELHNQKERVDVLSKNVICSVIKLGKASKWVALMLQKMIDAHQGEVQAIANAKAKVVNLKRSFQAKIKDLKEDVDSRIQWF